MLGVHVNNYRYPGYDSGTIGGERNSIHIFKNSAGDSKGHLSLEITSLAPLTLFHEVVKGKDVG